MSYTVDNNMALQDDNGMNVIHNVVSSHMQNVVDRVCYTDPLGGVDPLTSDNTPSSDPNLDPTPLAGYVIPKVG